MSGMQGGQYQTETSHLQPVSSFFCLLFVPLKKGYDLERQLCLLLAILWLFLSKFVPSKIFNRLLLSPFCRALAGFEDYNVFLTINLIIR
jgi:hypothetical protein